jgi:cell division protein FtsB
MFRSFLRPIAALAALSGLAAYATIMLRGPQGLDALANKHRETRLLQEQNDKLSHENEMKRQRIERLEHDPSTQEVELERMGFLHQHDTQFKTTDKSVQVGVGQAATPAPGTDLKTPAADSK